MAMYQTYACVSFAVLCAILPWLRAKREKRYGPLPPSPKADPLIGNLRAMASVVDEPRAYRDWGLELGSDIISVTIPGQVTIVLNSQAAADELLVKRSSIYSDRPHIPMVSSDNLVGWGNNTGMVHYGERWRNQRKMTHEVLHKMASEERWPLVERQSRLALQRILDNPAGFSEEVRRMAGSTLLMAVYGYEVTTANDSLVKVVEDAVEGFSQAVIVSNYFVNTAPFLQYLPEWFPGATWKAKANAWRHQKDLMLHVPYEWTKKKMAAGTAVPSMLSFWLNRYVHQESSLGLAEMEDRVRWAAGTIFSVASTRVFIMAMAMHPEIQARAQAEIDAVIGTRLPEIADQSSLPYVRRIVKEVFRWRMVLPLALPHACIQDDTYKGYHIPKGAIVAISNDPAMYPDPDRFDPDRFLDPSVPDAPTFGYGRRSCPGSHHAEASLFIIAAGLLAMFNIRPEVDNDGNVIPLKPEMGLNEAVRQLHPFKCRIAPRSERHEQIVRDHPIALATAQGPADASHQSRAQGRPLDVLDKQPWIIRTESVANLEVVVWQVPPRQTWTDANV
ncbi:cytochrome P450 family protein [Rhizoctonia solani AG-3 Rhs1AP]|uniref:Cytochrome P450 family protein n=1 Tax=Rhizoctonia solani AG-3 Rhs1AP TaxID=1086054 RepID=X8JAP0_9AGAM|nr:cytochrome P450 family protein [Rhizoctonia solani AG-3 Rhs1AP]